MKELRRSGKINRTVYNIIQYFYRVGTCRRREFIGPRN